MRPQEHTGQVRLWGAARQSSSGQDRRQVHGWELRVTSPWGVQEPRQHAAAFRAKEHGFYVPRL